MHRAWMAKQDKQTTFDLLPRCQERPPLCGIPPHAIPNRKSFVWFDHCHCYEALMLFCQGCMLYGLASTIEQQAPPARGQLVAAVRPLGWPFTGSHIPLGLNPI